MLSCGVLAAISGSPIVTMPGNGMPRLCFALLLTGFVTNAAADWTLMGGVTDIYSAYADKASVRRVESGHVQMWGMYNFSKPDISVTGHTHHSTRSLREYDCSVPRVRLISFVDHAEPMGTGRDITVQGDPGARLPRRWESVVPGAVDESFWKAACGKLE